VEKSAEIGYNQNDMTREGVWGQMKKRFAAACAVLLCLTLAGCGRWGIVGTELDGWLSSGAYTYDYGDSGSEDSGEVHYAELGEPVETYFFTYTVTGASFADDFDGYSAADGMRLLDTEVTVENTGTEEIPMSIYDFQVQWGDDESDFDYEVPALRRSDAAMPEEYSLAAGESASYHIVYEVPDSRSTFSVCYQERFRDNTVGDSYFVFFSIDKEGRAIATSET
jgi:hypothetical protein